MNLNDQHGGINGINGINVNNERSKMAYGFSSFLNNKYRHHVVTSFVKIIKLSIIFMIFK